MRWRERVRESRYSDVYKTLKPIVTKFTRVLKNPSDPTAGRLTGHDGSDKAIVRPSLHYTV